MAGWARRIEGEIIPSGRLGKTILLMRQEIGVVGGIFPWNFPFFLIARKMAPALFMGNTIIVKPSIETLHNASIFAKIVANIGLLKGVFNIVFGYGSTTGRAIYDDRDVGLLSFTGSVDTGARIMAAITKNITKVNLELGGKAPAIVAYLSKERMRRLISVVANGSVDLRPLVTHTYQLDDIEKAYELFANQCDGVMKVAIKTGV